MDEHYISLQYEYKTIKAILEFIEVKRSYSNTYGSRKSDLSENRNWSRISKTL